MKTNVSVLVVGALLVIGLAGCDQKPAQVETPVVTSPVASNDLAAVVVATNEFAVLQGKWQRGDGDYLIEIRSVDAGGKLDARYFNPRPIHVSRAEWRRENGGIHVFVELRDQNYPGATYKLRYRPEQDQLAGDYHQPLHQQTFDVYFIRQPR